MKNAIAFLLVCSTTVTVFAQEPPYVYQQFGYFPPTNEAGTLSEDQKAVLSDCVKLANERGESSKKSAEKMAAIYGNQALQYDYFGVYLTGCLADEKDGKGWVVQEKKGGVWEKVRPRYATRTFMKLDPTK